MGLADPGTSLTNFFYGSISVRTEACSCNPPVMYPSATPHAFLWFCLNGKPSLQESDNPFQKPWIEEKTSSTTCAYVCAYGRSRYAQGNDLPRWQHRAPQSRQKAERMVRKRLMVKTLPAFGVLPA